MLLAHSSIVLAIASLGRLVLCQTDDTAISSLVSEGISIFGNVIGLTSLDLSAAATELASLDPLLSSITAVSDWPAAASAIATNTIAPISLALAVDSSFISVIESSFSFTPSDDAAGPTDASAAASSTSMVSTDMQSATSAGLAPLMTAGVSGLVALGVMGAAVLV